MKDPTPYQAWYQAELQKDSPQLNPQAAWEAATERAAEIAFNKVRCDDRTDRWLVANVVAAHIRSELAGGG